MQSPQTRSPSPREQSGTSFAESLRAHDPDVAEPRATVTVRSVRPLLSYLRHASVDVIELLARHGVEFATLLNADSRLTHATAAALWRDARTLTGDRDLGLRVHSAADIQLLSSIGIESEYLAAQLSTSSDTVGEGFFRYVHHHALVHDGLRFDVTLAGGVMQARLVASEGVEVPRVMHEAMLAVPAFIAHHAAVTPPASLVLHLTRPRAGGPAPIDLRVVFDADEDMITLDERDLDAPLRGSNPCLRRSIEHRAAIVLSQLSPDHALVERVRALVTESLATRPSVSRTAARTGMSERTLSRRLEAAGTSHGAIVDEVRVNLARRLLLDPSLSVAAIALHLGYSGPGVFLRTFHRWFGTSPSAFRRARTAGARG